MEERGRGLTTIKRRMERDGPWVMEESEADEKNEGGVDKALCAKRKLCESETPSDQLVFPLQLLFFFCSCTQSSSQNKCRKKKKEASLKYFTQPNL